MGSILKFLKKIGIIILAVLVVPILLILMPLILFTPIFYHIWAEKDGENINTKIKIFGIEIKQKAEKKKQKVSRKRSETESDFSKEIPKSNPPPKKEKGVKKKEEKKKKNEKRGYINFLIDILSDLYNYPNKKQILILTLELFKKIIKNIRPKNISIQAEVGVGPFETGMLMAAIAAIAPELSFNIVGNFTDKVINVKLNISGRISLYKLIWPLVAFSLKKPIRRLIMDIIRL